METKIEGPLHTSRPLALRSITVCDRQQTIKYRYWSLTSPWYDIVERELDLKSMPGLPQVSITYYNVTHIIFRVNFLIC